MDNTIIPSRLKRNAKVKMEDYHQVEVDDFVDGYFLYLGCKQIDLVVPKDIINDIEAQSKAYLVSVYDYVRKSYYKILVCEYKKTSWGNGYTVKNKLAHANKAEDTCNMTINEFFEWMEAINETL